MAETLATIAANKSLLPQPTMVPTPEKQEEKRKKSRWGGNQHEKIFYLGMPTTLPTNLNKEQEAVYLLQLQLEQVNRKLRSGNLGISMNLEERSPSPEPIYSSDGKRLNTREIRTRRRLEEDRHNLVLQIQAINPEFKPPFDYKPTVIRVTDKVMIPQEENPDINFVGLLIGPRGNTLKSMEKETNAKIIIRGKGSIKEGKVTRTDGQPLPGEDEPLHAYITATNPEDLKKAMDKVKEIIRHALEVPENQSDLRRMQLRELALLNGTLRESDGRCSNCGAVDHKTWTCPDKPNVTNNVICTICGSVGHIANDCKQIANADLPENKDKFDEEYTLMMAELGGSKKPEGQKEEVAVVAAPMNAKLMAQVSSCMKIHAEMLPPDWQSCDNNVNNWQAAQMPAMPQQPMMPWMTGGWTVETYISSLVASQQPPPPGDEYYFAQHYAAAVIAASATTT